VFRLGMDQGETHRQALQTVTFLQKKL
jgi:hypothetical protein